VTLYYEDEYQPPRASEPTLFDLLDLESESAA